jgi:hypothetical protein
LRIRERLIDMLSFLDARVAGTFLKEVDECLLKLLDWFLQYL